MTTVWDPRCASTFIVDAHLGPQKPAQCMLFTTFGAKMRINIYVDARFQAPKARKGTVGLKIKLMLNLALELKLSLSLKI